MSRDRLVPKYYRAADGSEPVRDFLRSLRKQERVLVENWILRIGALCTLKNPDLPEPQSRHIEGDMRELRVQAAGNNYRILYAHSRRMVILLHAFRKSTQETPDAEKRAFYVRWKDFKARMNARPRRRPSPLGVGEAP